MKSRERIVIAAATLVVVSAAVYWSRTSTQVVAPNQPSASDSPVRTAPRIRPAPIEPAGASLPCRFLANGDFLCTEPVHAPLCGLSVLFVSIEVNHQPTWPDEHEAPKWITVESSQIIGGPEFEILEMGRPTSAGPEWSVSVDLSDTDAEVVVERPAPAQAILRKSELLLIFGPKREGTWSTALAVHCHWPGA